MLRLLDWNHLETKYKKRLKSKKRIFILGSRDISEKRILSILEKLPSSVEIIFGCLKEDYVEGLENSPQFKTLKLDKLINALKILETSPNNEKNLDHQTQKENEFTEKESNQRVLQTNLKNKQNSNSGTQKKLFILSYHQRDLEFILEEIKLAAVILINGSWHRTIHTRKEYWLLEKKKIPLKFISPFINEEEAQDYINEVKPKLDEILNSIDFSKTYTHEELIELATSKISKLSFDHTYQTGCLIASKGKILSYGYNKVLPYATNAMHFGSSREKNFSPPGDLNNYDAVHAEIDCLLNLGKISIQNDYYLNSKEKKSPSKPYTNEYKYKDTISNPIINQEPKAYSESDDLSLYINLLPCPTCAKAIAISRIKKIYYSADHSEGYAIKLLKAAGKEAVRIF